MIACPSRMPSLQPKKSSGNFSQACSPLIILAMYPNIGRDLALPDNTEGVLAVRYFGAEVSVGRGAANFPETSGCAVNGVGACLVCTRELKAPPVLYQLSIRTLMKIKS